MFKASMQTDLEHQKTAMKRDCDAVRTECDKLRTGTARAPSEPRVSAGWRGAEALQRLSRRRAQIRDRQDSGVAAP